MRPPERIDRVLALIEQIWKLNPDLRFLQLISVLQARYSQANDGIGRVEEVKDDFLSKVAFDHFYVEDSDFELFLEEYLRQEKDRTGE